MKPNDVPTRRRFFAKAGAALSAPLALAAASGSERAAEDADALKARLARLEDLDAIRGLNQRLAKHLNAGAREEAAGLFADPAGARVDGRIRGVSAEPFARQDLIELAAGRDTAAARIACTVELEVPIEPSCPLVEMARQQGGGVLRRNEAGVFENLYVKRDGVWKIARSEYERA